MQIAQNKGAEEKAALVVGIHHHLALEILCVQSTTSRRVLDFSCLVFGPVNEKSKLNIISNLAAETVRRPIYMHIHSKGGGFVCKYIASIQNVEIFAGNSIEDRDVIIGVHRIPLRKRKRQTFDSSNVPSVSVGVGARGGCVDTRSRVLLAQRR